MPRQQKFQRFDLVKIANNFGWYDTDKTMPFMSHFPSGCEAIILHSYKDIYNGTGTNQYAVHIRGKGHVAWYYENQLTLIKENEREVLWK